MPEPASEISNCSRTRGRCGAGALGSSTARMPRIAETAPEAQRVTSLAAPPTAPAATAPMACPAHWPPALMKRPKPAELIAILCCA